MADHDWIDEEFRKQLKGWCIEECSRWGMGDDHGWIIKPDS